MVKDVSNSDEAYPVSSASVNELYVNDLSVDIDCANDGKLCAGQASLESALTTATIIPEVLPALKTDSSDHSPLTDYEQEQLLSTESEPDLLAVEVMDEIDDEDEMNREPLIWAETKSQEIRDKRAREEAWESYAEQMAEPASVVSGGSSQSSAAETRASGAHDLVPSPDLLPPGATAVFVEQEPEYMSAPDRRSPKYAAREDALGEIEYDIELRGLHEGIHRVELEPEVGYGLPAMQIILRDLMDTSIRSVRAVSMVKRKQEAAHEELRL